MISTDRTPPTTTFKRSPPASRRKGPRIRPDRPQPTSTIGYNTETQARLSIPDTAYQAEARWNCAVWTQNELTMVGDLTSDRRGHNSPGALPTSASGCWFRKRERATSTAGFE